MDRRENKIDATLKLFQRFSPLKKILIVGLLLLAGREIWNIANFYLDKFNIVQNYRTEGKNLV